MSPDVLFYVLIALLVGAGYPIQAGINATIAQYHGHPLLAALTNTTVASLVLVVVILVMRVPAPSFMTSQRSPPSTPASTMPSRALTASDLSACPRWRKSSRGTSTSGSGGDRDR